MKQVKVYITEEQHEALRIKGFTEKTSVSALVRKGNETHIFRLSTKQHSRRAAATGREKGGVDIWIVDSLYHGGFYFSPCLLSSFWP
jgi:hypothetical protein